MSDHSPDQSDASRCISVHWSLPVQCVLSRAHRENWHETWHPESGNRLRYRYPTRATEELHHGAWHAVYAPRPARPLDCFTIQRCDAGEHADWAVDSENTHACPWCEVERLRAADPVRPSPDHMAIYLDQAGRLWADYLTLPPGDDVLPLVWAGEQARSKADLAADGFELRVIGWSK